MMIRRFLLAFGFATILAAPAHAQFFIPGTATAVCTTIDSTGVPSPCTGLYDQILNYIRQGLQLDQETITSAQTTISAAKAVLNTTGLAGQMFQDGTGAITQMLNLAKEADLLGGDSGAFIGNLTADYYPIPDDPMVETVHEQNATGNAIGQLGKVIGVVSTQLPGRAQTLAALTTEALQAIGRMQTQQDTHQVVATTGQDIHSLVSLNLAAAQAQHAAMLAQHDKQAMQDAWADQLATNYAPLPDPGTAPSYGQIAWQ